MTNLEEPVCDVWPLVAVEAELRGEAGYVLQRLCGHVVEIGKMSARVDHGKEEGGARTDLVELQV